VHPLNWMTVTATTIAPMTVMAMMLTLHLIHHPKPLLSLQTLVLKSRRRDTLGKRTRRWLQVCYRSTKLELQVQLILNFKQDASIPAENIHVQNIDNADDNSVPVTLNKTKPTADIERFFKQLPASSKLPGEKKPRAKCLSCA
jgi:hypothetical protein